MKLYVSSKRCKVSIVTTGILSDNPDSFILCNMTMPEYPKLVTSTSRLPKVSTPHSSTWPKSNRSSSSLMVFNSVVDKLVGGISPTDRNNLLKRLELLCPFLPPRSNADADADEDDEALVISHSKAKQDTSPTMIDLTRTPRRMPLPLIPRKRWYEWAVVPSVPPHAAARRTGLANTGPRDICAKLRDRPIDTRMCSPKPTL
mmetsp:Transcript_22506/g.64739  ORF Transcript_22506/g.64739 Transcript_22506/m.64739 type:complete len:202 (-) Transcript_22506:80-685(-)